MKPLHGHVARSIAAGKRPFLTVTVSPETFATIDRIATRENRARGRVIDEAIATLDRLAVAHGKEV